jgi:hypothetical protein
MPIILEEQHVNPVEHMKNTFAEIIKPTWSESGQSILGAPRTFIQASSNSGGPMEGDQESEVFRAGPDPALDIEADRREGDVEAEDVTVNPFVKPPTISEAKAALDDLRTILNPKRKSGIGHNPFEGDDVLKHRLEMLKMFLWRYTDNSQGLTWIVAADTVAHSYERGSHLSCELRKWARSFIGDRDDLPINLQGTWNVSLLDKGELAKEIHAHLQGIGKYVRALDIVHFLDTPDIKARYDLKKTISLATAQRWMHMMDYRWTKGPKGQYVDGHEREDVVMYRQNKFLPTMAELEWNLRTWKDGIEEIVGVRPEGGHTVVWVQDESVFHGNDRCDLYWVHKDEKATPKPKGEGASLMVTDFVSADYGWLRSPDGKVEARRLFRPGKNRDGYFNNADVLEHAQKAMDIVKEYYPDDNHVFLFDNATTHLKRADDALSARSMSKYPTHPDKPMFGVDTQVLDSNGKPVYSTCGKIQKQRVRMGDAKLPNGEPQSLYFPEGHERAGVFKGMAEILRERGFVGMEKVRAECPKFKCAPGAGRESCCCRRILYNQPDFVEVESLLEAACKARGFKCYFFPKFHCELSFIEACWGYAKRIYRMYPPLTKEADLERNAVKALDSVPLQSMRK